MLYKTIIIAAFSLFALRSPAYAGIKKLPGQWSLAVYGAWNTSFPASASMKGNVSSVINEALIKTNDYVVTDHYPFGDNSLSTMNLGAELMYRIPNFFIAPFVGLSIDIFNVDNTLETNGILIGPYASVQRAKMYMAVTSFTLGGEYDYGSLNDPFNAFAKLGIDFNLIGGGVTYQGQDASVNIAPRIGFHTEVGGRYNIPSTPLSAEASFGYKNANLIGRNTSDGLVDNTQFNLMDGKDAATNSPSKTIDWFYLKFGLRLWF